MWCPNVAVAASHGARHSDRFLPSSFSNTSIWSFWNSMIRCWQGWSMNCIENSVVGRKIDQILRRGVREGKPLRCRDPCGRNCSAQYDFEFEFGGVS